MGDARVSAPRKSLPRDRSGSFLIQSRAQELVEVDPDGFLLSKAVLG